MSLVEFHTGQYIEGQYQVLRRCRGAMGVVYIAVDPTTQKLYAVKSPVAQLERDPAYLERFRRESRLWVNLKPHPHIVQAHIYREVQGTPLLFLQYIKGSSLRDFLRPCEPLPLAVVVKWALQAASGMKFLHTAQVGEQRGIIHRDLKPQNVLIDCDGNVRITDLGLSKCLSDPGLTGAGIFLGTPLYASPEQFSGNELSFRSDMYSFGTILYEMLTGRPPFAGANSWQQLAEKVIHEEVAPVAQVRPQVPAALSALVESCLKKDPSQRPESFADIEGRLRQISARSDLAEVSSHTCPDCEMALPRGLERCPLEAARGREAPTPRLRKVSAEQSTGEVVLPEDSSVFLPAFSNAGHWRERESPALEIEKFRVHPHRPRVGEVVYVDIVVANRAPSSSAEIELPYVVPDTDAFFLQGEEESWRGSIPPDSAVRISYQMVPTREGTFRPARVEFSWVDPEVGRRSLLCGTIPPIHVEAEQKVPLVGRESQLQEVCRLLDLAARGHSVLLVVQGELGVGKSTFAGALMREAEARGFTVACAAASRGSADPLEVFAALLRSYLDLGEAVLSQEEIRALIMREFSAPSGEESSTGRLLVDCLLGESLSSRNSVARKQDSRERVRPEKWFHVFVRMASEAPVLVVLEDFHNAGVVTAELLVSLVQRAHERGVPIFFCVTTEPAIGGAEAANSFSVLRDFRERVSGAAQFVREIQLENFTECEVREALEAVFPGGELPERVPWLAETIFRSTGGNPFLVVETLRDLSSELPGRERYAIYRYGSGWELGRGITPQWLSHHVPKRVETALRRRLRDVPRETRAVLEIAAVLGEEFDVSVLRQLLPDVSEEAFEDALDFLESESFIRPVDQALTRYRFCHTLQHAALERALTERHRRKTQALHRRIADLMEDLCDSEQRDRRLLEVAEHRIAGGRIEEGFSTLLRGIRALLEEERYYHCYEPLRKARELAPLLRKVPAELLYLEGETYRETGRLKEALHAYRQYLAEKEAEGDARALARAWLKLGEVSHRLGDRREAELCFHRALETAGGQDDQKLVAEAHNCLGLLAKEVGALDKARAHLEESLRRRRLQGERTAMCTALINLGNVYRSCALYEECERALSEALSLAEELGVAHLRAGAALSLGNLKLTTGELCEAERQYRSALERYRHLGDRVREGAVLFNLAQVFSQQKKEAEACRFYAEALRVARITEHRRGEMRALTEYARCKVALGQTAEGRRMAQEALPIARELDNRNGLLRNLVTIAFSDQAAGADTQEVLKEIEEAGRTLEGVHGEVKYLREIIQPSPVDGSFLLVPDRIAQKAERLFQIGHSEGRPEECAFACAVKAIVSARKGEKEKAKQYARDACSHLRDTGTMPPAGSAFGEVLALAARETGEEIAPG